MKEFGFVLPYVVRVADINYGGHVSNAAVLNYFQDARIAFLAALGPYSELDIGAGCGLIMPESHVRYHAEMFLGDVLQIGVRTDKIGRSSFDLAYRIERQGELTAEGTTPLVAFDYTARKPRRLPPTFRQALED
ncbi:acyl-CoA thioesterase [Geoalkalibacter halelectricus]|uniref:Acyl-CoA thioesterase n=1 Tax=Geoalkalibacter halelectricus TaxID=2847045 RepID=A0ABY5ZK43_9BACT|nr:thioesterase family protein [Geoalkalibacter halelectricus]MDO3379456.1 acyl-CoA thioesterase [Geoalkalibacter halelectricus]UWZ79515.1 acyl-CoA thioesterase [Geoalkalibacter halelectricus]